jgi:cob(I)alamin adenosyltransferase
MSEHGTFGPTWERNTMRLYTGKGDSGGTDLLGERVQKDDPRIELLGALDETTSAIGFARAIAAIDEISGISIETQRDLYKIMAELAFTDAIRPDAYIFSNERVDWLSSITDELSGRIELPPQFIVPGDTPGGAAFDVARTIVRRAERLAVTSQHQGLFSNGEILRYLNRLSSLLFVLARTVDAASGQSPIKAKSGSRD